MVYDREAAVAYARKWAFGRNPDFYVFDEIGGDCTNFASQCIYAGTKVMNFTRETGWYYISLNRRAPAWTGVEFLMQFLSTNTESGPFGSFAPLEEAQPGDVIFLSFKEGLFSHTLVVVSNYYGNIKIAAHSDDSFNRPLSSYIYREARLLHIEGYNAN